MAVRQPVKKCGQCSYIDRETYKGANCYVCYLVQKMEGNPVAIKVTDKTKACGYFKECK